MLEVIITSKINELEVLENDNSEKSANYQSLIKEIQNYDQQIAESDFEILNKN